MVGRANFLSVNHPPRWTQWKTHWFEGHQSEAWTERRGAMTQEHAEITGLDQDKKNTNDTQSYLRTMNFEKTYECFRFHQRRFGYV